jgi:integrase
VTRTSSRFRYWIYQRRDSHGKRWKGRRRPWTLQWVEREHGDPHMRSASFPTKGAAQAEADRLDGLARARAGLVDDVQVKEYVARWFRRIEPTLVPNTVRVYRSSMKYVLAWRGEAWLRDLTAAEVKDFLADQLRRGLAKKTVANLRGVLHAMLQEAVEDAILATNPATSKGRSRALKLAPTRAERRQKVKALTAPQLAAFLTACAEVRPDRLLRFRLMAMTGVRPGEAAALQWDDLDLAGGTALIRRSFSAGRLKTTKTGVEERVDLGRDTVAALKRWDRTTQAAALRRGQSRPPYVFPSQRGTPIDQNYIQLDFKAVLKAAGLPPHFTPYCLRHTYATLQLVRGISIYYVQKQLRHATIGQTVDLYGSWLPAGNRDHADSLEQVISESAGDPSRPGPDRRLAGSGPGRNRTSD